MKRFGIIILIHCFAFFVIAAAEAPENDWDRQLSILQAYLSGSEDITPEEAQEAVVLLRALFEEHPEILDALRAGSVPEEGEDSPSVAYVLNIRSNRFHLPTCIGIKDMAEKNRVDYFGSRDLLLATGFKPCQICNP